MYRNLGVLIAGVVLALFASSPMAGDAKPAPVKLSFVQLIANPQKYQGKLVEVAGFLHLGFEDNALYLHKEDYERLLFKNGIWVDVPTEQVKSAADSSDHYVSVVGTFDARKPSGHFDGWSGKILVDRIDLIKSRAELPSGVSR